MSEEKAEGEPIREDLQHEGVALMRQKQGCLTAAQQSLLPSAGRYRNCYVPYEKSLQLGACDRVKTAPLIEGQVPVSKLGEQGPLQNLLGRLVLDEVDNDVL